LDLDFEINSKDLLGYVPSYGRTIQKLGSLFTDTATSLVEGENISPIVDLSSSPQRTPTPVDHSSGLKQLETNTFIISEYLNET